MADPTAGNQGTEPVARPDIAWDDLTHDEQAGMTRDYWEQSLTREARIALVDRVCSRPGCAEPRWHQLSSFYCERHTREIASVEDSR